MGESEHRDGDASRQRKYYSHQYANFSISVSSPKRG